MMVKAKIGAWHRSRRGACFVTCGVSRQGDTSFFSEMIVVDCMYMLHIFEVLWSTIFAPTAGDWQASSTSLKTADEMQRLGQPCWSARCLIDIPCVAARIMMLRAKCMSANRV